MIELRYSKKKFQFTLLSAIMLTAMFTLLAWMISVQLTGIYATTITASVALIFFVFCSVGMLSRYYRDEIILAVRQTGLFDKRLKQKIINWDEIKEVVLWQRESEFQLEVYLWPRSNSQNGNVISLKNKEAPQEPLKIDLSPFEVDIPELMRAIDDHANTRMA